MFTCLTLSAFTQTCGSLISGGVDKLYMIAYKDLDGQATIATSGLISDITPLSGKTFVEVELTSETVGFTEDSEINIQNGTGSFKVALNLVVNNFNNDSRKFVDSIVAQPVAIIVKMKSGKYTFIGGSGYARASAIKNGSGTAGNDRNGYEITITSVESELLREIDPTLIATLIA